MEWVDEEARPLYHAALAHGANHLVTLTNEALDRLRDAGVTHPERVLGPLLRAALENTLSHGDAVIYWSHESPAFAMSDRLLSWRVRRTAHLRAG